MEALWYEYQKTQSKAGFHLEEEHPELVKRTKLEEIWAWEDYAVDKFLGWLTPPEELGHSRELEKERADLA